MDFRRKRIRLSSDNYRGQRSYFLTLCTEGRRNLFSDNERAAWVVARLRECAAAEAFAVYAYCVMPDHLHTLVYGLKDTCVLSSFVKRFKHLTSFEAKKKYGLALWQGRFYDHILRRPGEDHAVAWYIWMNPVRKGLCARAADYPHSGSFTEDWARLARPLEDWQPPWKM